MGTNNLQGEKQKTAVLIGAVIAVISAAFVPNIALDALAAVVACEPDKDCIGTDSGDTISGTDGADNISGRSGGDAINAKGGGDTVSGGDGGDSINGGGGNDKLNGASGDDTLTGGAGADQFDCGEGTDTITDFNADEGDTKTADCENPKK